MMSATIAMAALALYAAAGSIGTWIFFHILWTFRDEAPENLRDKAEVSLNLYEDKQ